MSLPALLALLSLLLFVAALCFAGGVAYGIRENDRLHRELRDLWDAPTIEPEPSFRVIHGPHDWAAWGEL
jgi:hypothetical protein